MRRASDRRHGERTGQGRRARDRLLDETSAAPKLQKLRSEEVKNLAMFLGDDLRESAVAMGGLENFLVHAQKALAEKDLSAGELRALVQDDEVVARLELLSDAISSLRQSMSRIYQEIEQSRPEPSDEAGQPRS